MRGTRDSSAVILDRHPLWLDAMDKLVEGVGVEVVGRATDQDDAVSLIGERKPDLFIAGLDPSQADQLECIKRACAAHPGLRCVVLAESATLEAVNAAFAAGAYIYCAKTAEQGDLAAAIRQAREQSIYFASGVAASPLPTPRDTEPSSEAHDLTRRELEILRLVAEGHSNSQLAAMLWVTEQTVKFHLSNIYRKLDVANRTEASRWAQLNGLLPNQRGLETASAA